MDWSQLLKSHLDEAYRSAENLMKMVEADDLTWKPSTGENWMTTGQLLHHITGSCGSLCKAFVTDDWGAFRPGDDSQETKMPSAEDMVSSGSVTEALTALANDKQLALDMIAQAADRFDEAAPAPWDPTPIPLCQRLLSLIDHLTSHKAQLFYYLKLQGKPVNTMHYYGMA